MTFWILEQSFSDNFLINSVHKVDQWCQVYIPSKISNGVNSLICNRYIDKYSNFHDAEVQTVLSETTGSTIVRYLKAPTADRFSQTPTKLVQDKCVQTNDIGFFWYASLESDEHMTELAGTTFENFNVLLSRMYQPVKNEKLCAMDRLLIFLVKMKTGLTYSALSVLFRVHRTTISKISITTLQHLTGVTQEFVAWPDKLTVLGTMPECFKPDHTKTQVIIDCTEFRIDIPSSVENRVWTYSHYKHGFTAKVLFGITPGGLISFKSKACGGRISDSAITKESHIVDVLENDDSVLADKGFPEIKSVLDESGKRIYLVMPPFLKRDEFT